MKICPSCGQQMNDDQKFCTGCGAMLDGVPAAQQFSGPAPGLYQQSGAPMNWQQPGMQPKMNGLAIASLVCSITGMIIFGIILCPLGVIFGGVALSQISKNPGKYSGKGLAVAGLVVGLVGLVLVLIMFIACGSFFAYF